MRSIAMLRAMRASREEGGNARNSPHPPPHPSPTRGEGAARGAVAVSADTLEFIVNLPLQGLLVVSIEQAVAAPMCTCRLADAGARVIKVERPEGDFARTYDTVAGGECSYFVWLNRGKESVVLDLRSEEHTSELQSLAYLVCRLLLEKKKTNHNIVTRTKRNLIDRSYTH